MRYLFTALLLLCATTAQAGVFVGFGQGSSPCAVEEDFSDALSGWTNAYGAITASGGVGVGNTWAFNLLRNDTSLGDANNSASADVYLPASGSNVNDSAGVAVRVNGSQGYLCVLTATGVPQIHRSNAADSTNLIATFPAATVSLGATHTIQCEIDGSNITLTIDGEAQTPVSNSTYSTGNYAGVFIRRSASNTAFTVDNVCAQ